MNESIIHLRKIIRSQVNNLSEEAWHDIEGIWEPVTFKRKTQITQRGQIERNLYFITEGVQRVYYDDEAGREATLVFTYPFSFGGVLDSFLTQRPSRYSFETLTKSLLLKTSYSRFNMVAEKHPAFDMFIRTAINGVVSGLLERIVELQCFTSDEKFKALLRRSPHILQLVPHKYLANYLGIDPTNFSKLLNSVKI